MISLASSFKHDWGYWGWDGGDGYTSFVRLRHAEDAERIIARSPELVKRFFGDYPDFKLAIGLTPVKNFRMDDGVSSMRIVWILLTLATTILFIVTLNYILISISSMSRRAKSIGVHKCNGADGSTISVCLFWRQLLFCWFHWDAWRYYWLTSKNR